ncbi:MAG TPA: TrkA family potassium uptake protein [Candidatus Baltobacteraceae bacterium]|jgi:trk system potassium uptake protein TrkA
MKYIIVGCGRVGSMLAKLLVEEGHEVTVVDENPAAFKRLGSRFTGQVELGTGIDAEVIRRAGGESADGFASTTNGDNRNVMAALIAQRLFNIKKVVARIYDPPRGKMYRELGIETVCPTTVGAQLIRDILIAPPQVSAAFDFGKLSSLRCAVTDAVANRRVSEIERDGSIRVAAIRTNGVVRVASPNDVLARGDELNVILAPEALDQFTKLFADTSLIVPEKVGA